MCPLCSLQLAIENIGVHLEEPFRLGAARLLHVWVQQHMLSVTPLLLPPTPRLASHPCSSGPPACHARVLPLNQMIAGTIRALHAMADAQEGAAALAAFAAQAGDPPAEGRGARTVLRKSHADFSPRAWHALSLARPGGGSAWAGGVAAKAPAWTPPRASPGAVPAPPPPRPHVPPAEAEAVAARDGKLPVVREDSSLGQPGTQASAHLPPSSGAVRCAVSVHALPPLQQHQPGLWQQGQGPPPLRLHAPCSAGLPPAAAGITSTACPAGRCK